ncbi:MAG: ABC transporter ATP-binding protein [Anaerolineales bacterium]
MSAKAILELENLGFRYHPDSEPVLVDISACILEGKITAVLGPNGAGKTTMLHLLMGLKADYSGAIHLMGRRLAAYTRRELSRWIGWVPQIEEPRFAFTVFEYVMMGRTPHLGWLQLPSAEDQAITLQSLQDQALHALADRPIGSLSGGEFQMVRIARALAQKPRILVLDEPTAHLDPGNKDRVMRTMLGLMRQGITVVYTTHEPESALAIADQAMLIKEGRLQDAGAAEDVLTAEGLTAAFEVPLKVQRVDGTQVVVPAGSKR